LAAELPDDEPPTEDDNYPDIASPSSITCIHKPTAVLNVKSSGEGDEYVTGENYIRNIYFTLQQILIER
jgi:hypothetical protein